MKSDGTTLEAAETKLKGRRRGGRVPLGYVLKRDTDSSWLEEDPSKMQAVRMAFFLAGTGKFSLREIAREVSKLGLTGRDGGPLGASSLRNLLIREGKHEEAEKE